MERPHSTSLRLRRQQQAPTEFAWDRTIQDQTLVTEETRLHECTEDVHAGFRLLCLRLSFHLLFGVLLPRGYLVGGKRGRHDETHAGRSGELEKKRKHPWRVGSMLNNQPSHPALWCRQYDGHASAASRSHIQSKADNPTH
jgi:hypothetical protein